MLMIACSTEDIQQEKTFQKQAAFPESGQHEGIEQPELKDGEERLLAAENACSDKEEGVICALNTPMGMIEGTCTSENGTIICTLDKDNLPQRPERPQ